MTDFNILIIRKGIDNQGNIFQSFESDERPVAGLPGMVEPTENTIEDDAIRV